MKLDAVPLTEQQRNQLSELFRSEGFDLMVKAIEAKIFELTFELGEASTVAKVEGIDLASRVPKAQEKLVTVLRWKAAYEVLAEMSSQKSSPVLAWEVTV